VKKMILGVVAICFLLTGTVFSRNVPRDLEVNEVSDQPLKSVKLPGGRTPPGMITDECWLIETGPNWGTLGPFIAGDQFLMYQDPGACSPAPYPYQVSDISFALLNYDGANPQLVDFMVHVYDADLTDPGCPVPGALLCSSPVFADIYFEPGAGYIFGIPLVEICCVNGPFFMALELVSVETEGVSIYITDPAGPGMPCHCYIGWGEGWNDFLDIFAPLGQFNLSDFNYSHGWAAGQNECEEDDVCANHKMHFPQLPDPGGWDVNATAPICLADDWQCSETGPLDDIHWWGSWRHDDIGIIDAFIITIHDNIAEGPNGWSVPGNIICGPMILFEGDYTVTPMEPSVQGWYDPVQGEVIPGDHQQYFRYDYYNPGMCTQVVDEIYWLRISAVVVDPNNTHWGWKSSQDHFMDDAVWGPEPDTPLPPDMWWEIYEPMIPPDPISNFAELILDPAGGYEYGWGEDAFDEGWYWYENSEWWNIWFYDHPLDFTRMKEIILEDAFVVKNPNFPDLPAWIEIAFNWSTEYWEPGSPTPPIPGEFDPAMEDVLIGRETIFIGDIVDYTPIEGFFEILEYNPEWVSIDIRGFNIWFQGVITHTCLPREPQSLDLSFCITKEIEEPTGACCDDETGVCVDYVLESDCPPPLRFAANTLCVDLEPPCGPVGACCDEETGDCVDFVPIGDCPPEFRFEANTLCADLVPPCGPVGACCDDDNADCVDFVPIGDCPPEFRFEANTLCADLEPPCGVMIPTLSEWGILILALLLVGAGTVAIVRRRKEVTA
jgi:hypothetical protein